VTQMSIARSNLISYVQYFANAVLNSLSELADIEYLEAHHTVIDAIICAKIIEVQRGKAQVLLVEPVLLAGLSFLGLAMARDDGLPVEASQAIYLMSQPPSLKSNHLIRNMRQEEPSSSLSLGLVEIADFNQPTPARDLVRSLSPSSSSRLSSAHPFSRIQ
jgi:hypothetical protein